MDFRDVQTDKQMLFNQQQNTNPSYFHQQPPNMHYNVLPPKDKSIQPTLRYPSMTSMNSENTRPIPGANFTANQTNYSPVPTPELNAIKNDTNYSPVPTP